MMEVWKMITFLLVSLFYLTFLNIESKHEENMIKFPDETIFPDQNKSLEDIMLHFHIKMS